MPREFEAGALYFSEEYGIVGHLCACGCGNKTITPIGPVDWKLTIKNNKPSLEPSIGNWELPCRSHYWIRDGLIHWSDQWTEKEIMVGREREDELRKSYFNNLERQKKKQSIFSRILNWIFRRS